MRSAEEKLKNMASAAKEHTEVFKAKLDEKAEKAAARTPEEREMAHERRKAREAQAKMELHQAKAGHAAEKLAGKQAHVYGHTHELPGGQAGYQSVPQSQSHQPVGTVDPMTGTGVPTYPLGGH